MTIREQKSQEINRRHQFIMTPFSTQSSLSLLLAMTIAAVTSCPLASGNDCQYEFEPYISASNTYDPVYLTVSANLIGLTNEGNDFRRSLNRYNNFEVGAESIEGSSQNACYAYSAGSDDSPAAYVGCTQYYEVQEHTGFQLNCRWNYTCDYDKNRIPQYLWRAECNATSSVAVNYPVPVVKRESCNTQSPWELVIETVPVACTCKN